jgi:hypothetical protein
MDGMPGEFEYAGVICELGAVGHFVCRTEQIELEALGGLDCAQGLPF